MEKITIYRRNIIFLIIIFLIVMIYVSFSQILNHEFINFDDNEYVAENSNVQSGLTFEGLKWAFTYKEPPDMRYFPRGIVKLP